MEINMGPQHPATHGVLRLILSLDGETVVEMVPDIGYLHRNGSKWQFRLDDLQCHGGRQHATGLDCAG